MKITKRQLKRIIKEEKSKLLKEQYGTAASPGGAIDAVERGLVAVALAEIMAGNMSFTDQVYAHAIDGDGLDEPEIQMAIDQLMDRYGTGGR